MRKTKRKQLRSIAAGRQDATSAEFVNLPKARVGLEANVDEDWVVVKKQLIRILIPPLPVVVPTNHGQSKAKQMQPGARKRGRPKVRRKVDVSLLEEKTQCEEHRKISISDMLAPLLNHAPDEWPNAMPAIVAEASNAITGSSNSLASHKDLEQGSCEWANQKEVELTLNPCHQSEDVLLEIKDDNGEFKNPVSDSQDVAGESASALPPLSEAVESASSPGKEQEVHLLESVQCLNNFRVQDRNIRALVLEHKLELAGGVSKWLISKGLERFVDMFQKEKMGKFELLNLTMGRLKDMGLNAVGPRRKLIHAIDCLTQP